MVRYSSSTVSAEHTALMTFTARATYSGPGAKLMKKRAVSIHIGFPGGWPTCSPSATVIYSGQSQKEAVGSTVSRYVTRLANSTPQPTRARHHP